MAQKSVIVAISIIALTNAVPVFAAPLFTSAPIDQGQFLQVAASPSPMSNAELSRLVGVHVDNAQGERVGVVEAVHFNKGGAVNLIVGIGGYLDLGDRDVSLNFDKLQMSGTDRKSISVNMSKAELKALPKFEFSNVKNRGTVYGDPE